jgi:protein-tyrosine phosphatase
MELSHFRTTLPCHRLVVTTNGYPFQLRRLKDDPDGIRRVEINGPRTMRPGAWHMRLIEALRENQRFQIQPGMYLTIRNAEKQSRIQVIFEAQPGVRLLQAPAHSLKEHMKPLRRVNLPVKGSLLLHSMPARKEEIVDFLVAMGRNAVSRVVCLTANEETAKKSPDYAELLAHGVPWKHHKFPVPDYGVPADTNAFWILAAEIADALWQGEHVLVHCGAGIGRTGTFATAVACQLGLSLSESLAVVAAAGSRPETDSQSKLLAQKQEPSQ